MTLVKRTNNLFPQIPSFFDDFLGRDLSNWFSTTSPYRESSFPAANIRETDKDYTIELAAPGMDKKDFNIEFENDLLTISSEKKLKKRMKKAIISEKNSIISHLNEVLVCRKIWLTLIRYRPIIKTVY